MPLDSKNIFDEINKVSYTFGKFLGKGAFAKCYELIDENNNHFASKIIPLSNLKGKSNRKGLEYEIKIHQTLNHENIVKITNSFEDMANLYIVLELCSCQSLLEMYRRRGKFLIPETRYFTKQIAHACQYLHENNIIHRDIKLANVFLDQDLKVKLGDFGMAKRLRFDSEKRKTICGTPNYMAPEILNELGHSFEVDVWAFGVLLYIIAIGKPPFETSTRIETYERIKKNKFIIPHDLSDDVREIIYICLSNEAKSRPSMTDLLELRFFKEFTPKYLPNSVLSCPPKFESTDIDYNAGFSMADEGSNTIEGVLISDRYLNELHYQIMQVITDVVVIIDSDEKSDLMRTSEEPKLAPVFWVANWVDWTKKYGFGYLLNDSSTGILYNDGCNMILASNNSNVQLIDSSGQESFHTTDNFPKELAKKIKVNQYMSEFMTANLKLNKDKMANAEKESMARMPYVKMWLKNKTAILICLSNGTFQVNFFEDHVKLVLCPLLSSVTCFGGNEELKTYSFKNLYKNGLTKELLGRLKYISESIQKMFSIPDNETV